MDNNFMRNFTITTGRVTTPIGVQPQTQTKVPTTDQNGNSFSDILKQKLNTQTQEINFSKHALARINQRNIDMSETQVSRLNTAVDKAGSKGLKDTLVLIDSNAFIVNVPSKTIITALNGDELKENVFTNIDGAVIV